MLPGVRVGYPRIDKTWALSQQVPEGVLVRDVIAEVPRAKARWVRQSIDDPKRIAPKYLVLGVMRRERTGSGDSSSFATVLLTPETIRRLLTRVVDVARLSMLEKPVVVEYHCHPFEHVDFWKIEPAFDGNAPEEYEATLGKLDARLESYIVLDEDPAEIEADGYDWASEDGDDTLLRCDIDTPMVNWELYSEGGTVLTAMDFNVAELWERLGSAQGFYYKKPKWGSTVFRKKDA